MEDNYPVPAEREQEHFVSIRITTEGTPDLKKIMAAAARLGTVRGINYDVY